MINIVGVKFKGACKIYDFDAAGLEIAVGKKVLVDTERGMSLATAVTGMREVAVEAAPKELKKVLRAATPEDLEQERKNKEKGTVAQQICLKKINEHNLPMKLAGVEYIFDGSKAIFYFTADGRVDFRELVKDLAREFHTRIEMRQIGVRDAARQHGGVGPCGRELCCSSFLMEFEPVSIKMAKEQGISLNPAKISGICGRLMCCLSYEREGNGEGARCGGCHGHEKAQNSEAGANGSPPLQN